MQSSSSQNQGLLFTVHDELKHLLTLVEEELRSQQHYGHVKESSSWKTLLQSTRKDNNSTIEFPIQPLDNSSPEPPRVLEPLCLYTEDQGADHQVTPAQEVRADTDLLPLQKSVSFLPSDGENSQSSPDVIIHVGSQYSTVSTGRKKLMKEMFLYLDKKHSGYLTVDDCVSVLEWFNPERSPDRDKILKTLLCLSTWAGIGGRRLSRNPQCDFTAFSFLMGQFDTSSQMFGGDLEVKALMAELQIAFRAKAKHEEQEERDRKIKADMDKSYFKNHFEVAMDAIPALAIMANAVVLGISSDVNPDGIGWQVCELVFLFLFSAEFVIKIRMQGMATVMIGPEKLWNYFDLFCIIVAALEQLFYYLEESVGGFSLGDYVSIPLLKMLKLFRLARLVRLLRFRVCRELKMMVQGVVSGVRVIIWAIVLLFFGIFALAIVMRKVVGEEQAEFSTLPSAFFTLFRCFTDGCAAYDGTPLAENLRYKLGQNSFGLIWMLFYISVVLFVTIGIFNLIMAIFIDNVASIQTQRKHQQLGETADATEIRFQQVLGAWFKTDGGLTDFVISQRSQGQFLRLLSRLWDCLVYRFRRKFYTIDDHKRGSSKRASRVSTFTNELGEEEKVITKSVFSEWLEAPEIEALLQEAEVETSTKWELFDALDVDGGGELTVNELVSGLMKLRGPVTKIDIVATRLKLTYVTELVEEICHKLGIKLSNARDTEEILRTSFINPVADDFINL